MYVPRRQVTRRKQHHPWLPWFHQEGNRPSRPVPSTPSSRHTVSSGRFSSAQGRRTDTGLDPRPPAISAAPASWIISFLLERLYWIYLSIWFLLSPPGKVYAPSTSSFSHVSHDGKELASYFVSSLLFSFLGEFGGGRTTSGGTIWAALLFSTNNQPC